MALRLEMEEAEVVQENVESFPVAELIGRFMSPKYFIDLEVLDPLFYGMPVSRRRLYVKLFLDRTIVNCECESVVCRLCRIVPWTWEVGSRESNPK